MIKLNKLAILTAVVCGTPALASEGRQAYYESNEYESNAVAPVGFLSHSSHCDCGEAVCGCEMAPSDPACGAEMMMSEPGCGMELMSNPGCDMGEPGCGMDMSCSSNSCGGLGMGGILDNLDCGEMEDPWVLFGEACGWSAGGWLQMGAHSKALPLFNSRPDEFQLHQAWLYAEKAIDTSNGFSVGGRIDYLYGTDSQDTQAFGIGNDHWDNGWDNGTDYGQAIPQLYLEAGYGDLSVKVGHFYTIIGWEVVQATGNFFYSHAYTMYNSEPFTHTGALATYNASEDVTIWGGYTLGWDSGFEDNGDAFLGGFSASVTDDVTLIYATTFGRFDDGDAGIENGYMHSIVADIAVTDSLQYIFQTDLLDTEDETGADVRRTFDINQYLIYSLSDCLAVGTRFEWYDAKTGVLNGNGSDVYAVTTGLNFKPTANLMVRPEIRHDRVFGDKTGILENDFGAQTTIGVDTIFTF